MKKTKKALASLAIAGMVLSMAPASIFAADANRIEGADRYATSIKIAEKAYTEATTAIIAAGNPANLVDSLAAAPLAAQEKAPIYLTNIADKVEVEAGLLDSLKKLGVTKVIAVGAAAKDAATVAALEKAGVTVEKLAGDDRIATAEAINAKLTDVKGTIVVGLKGEADAMSVASFAAANKYKIVIADRNGVTTATDVDYILGGPTMVKTIDGAERIAGADRYATNEDAMKKLSFEYGTVYVANGLSLADALAASVLAAQTKSPILLSNGSAVKAAAVAGDKMTSSSKVIALGGTGAVSNAALNSVKANVPATLAVESVSAINLKQVEVKFNKEVDEDSAEDAANYYLLRTGDSSAVKLSTLGTVPEVKLQDDNKTVIITATGTNALTTEFVVNKNTAYKFIVDGVKATSGEKAAKVTEVLLASDSVAPTFDNVEAKAKDTTSTVTLTFSEPVNPFSGLVKVDGKNASVAQGDEWNELTITTNDALDAGSTYKLEVIDFTDYSGNFITGNPVVKNFTVVKDSNAPRLVEGVTVKRDNYLEITFDKSMDTSTLNSGNVKLLNKNSVDTAAVSTVLAKSGSTKIFRISLTGTPFDNNVFRGTLVLTDDILDSAGNSLVTAHIPVTITKDVTGPSVVEASFKKADATGTYGGVSLATGAIVVKFNEDVNLVASTVGSLKLVDNNALDVTSTYITNTEIAGSAISSDDATEWVIPLAAAITSSTDIDALTIHLPKGMVQDKAEATNNNVAAVRTFNVQSGTNVSDTTAPSVTSATKTTDPNYVNIIQVAVTEANDLDAATVKNVNNYRLDGAPLPEGSYIVLTGAAPSYTIEIYLPDGKVSKSKNYTLYVTGIKDENGNTASAKSFNTVALVDTVAPVLKTAVLNTNGTVTFAFDDDNLGVDPAATDIVVTLNGKVLTATGSPAYTVTRIAAGADSGKYALAVNTLKDNGADTNPSTADDFIYIDVNANGSYDSAVDIKVATGASVSAGQYDLRKASSLKVATAATPSAADQAGNIAEGDISITIK